eukprot:s1306_g5.t1
MSGKGGAGCRGRRCYPILARCRGRGGPLDGDAEQPRPSVGPAVGSGGAEGGEATHRRQQPDKGNVVPVPAATESGTEHKGTLGPSPRREFRRGSLRG